MVDMDHDNVLFSVLTECKTLPVFLDHIFGFLYRRTDFYQEPASKTSPVGIPFKLAQSMVYSSLMKWKQESPTQMPEQYANSDVACEVEVKSYNDHESMEPTRIPLHNIFNSSDSYNGQQFDNYCWSQSIKELEVTVLIPDGTTSRDLDINIEPQALEIRLLSGPVLVKGKLRDKVKSKDAMWSIHGRRLEVHMEKNRELWWDCLLQSEPKLDVQKLDCSRPFEELSEEAQATIDELQWNQIRKTQGLPTSEEIKLHNILRKAWNQDDSPFRGPYDPANVHLN